MCPLVLAIKTFFSPIFDSPGEKNADEVFSQIGGGKSAILGTLWAAKKILAPFGGGGVRHFCVIFFHFFFPPAMVLFGSREILRTSGSFFIEMTVFKIRRLKKTAVECRV